MRRTGIFSNWSELIMAPKSSLTLHVIRFRMYVLIYWFISWRVNFCFSIIIHKKIVERNNEETMNAIITTLPLFVGFTVLLVQNVYTKNNSSTKRAIWGGFNSPDRRFYARIFMTGFKGSTLPPPPPRATPSLVGICFMTLRRTCIFYIVKVFTL